MPVCAGTKQPGPTKNQDEKFHFCCRGRAPCREEDAKPTNAAVEIEKFALMELVAN